MKLFDDGDDDVEKISKIEINKEFAKRYEHNKKREDLQKLEEMKKKGLIDESGSGSESESESDSFDDDDDEDVEKDVKFFDALLKVRKKDPILKEKDAKLFESSDDDEDEEDEGEIGGDRRKDKPKYLKDVMAQHLMEEGPEFDDEDEEGENNKKKKVKSYVEEQEDVRKEVLDALAKEEIENESDDDGFLREKEKQDDDDDDDDDEGDGVEIKKKLDEYFGDDEKLDENDMFLKDFFKNKLWIDKDKGKRPMEDDELVGISDDEEALERQEDYEREYNFRFEENASDRVLGHSRVVEGSVRKESNARKQQRERKKEREARAEIERREEVKRLKNLKKREIQEKLEKIREIAGIDGDGSVPLTEADLEEDFDPEEFDKKMKAAFGEEYYQAEDVDPGFVDEEGESDLEKPDFDKEDELLGLPKDWDVIKSKDGFFAEREKRLKSKVDNEGDEEDSDGDGEENEDGGDDDGELQPEEGKRKRKRKLSLKEKVALDKELEELYKLDYEDAIGDLKTRFKYREVAPRKYGLSAAEILCIDEKELNQYVSLKKLAPYREKEWKVHPMLRSIFMKKKLLLQGRSNGQTSHKKRRTDGGSVGETSGSRPQEDVKTQGEQPSNDETKLSRKARRKLRQKEKKLSQSRLVAYGKIPSSSKSKSKS